MLLRYAQLAIILSCFLLSAGESNPQSISAYINAHRQVDLASLLGGLSVKNYDSWGPVCADDKCRANVIDVTGAQPPQAIVRVEDMFHQSAHWLRYEKNLAGSWKISGCTPGYFTAIDSVSPELANASSATYSAPTKQAARSGTLAAAGQDYWR